MMNTKKWVRMARCRDIPLREGRAVKAGDCEVAIFNLGDRFLAVENRCPHKSGPLADGILSGATVTCPLHAWKFALETGVGTNAPSAAACVRTFAARVEDEVIWVELPLGSGQTDEILESCVNVRAVSPWAETQAASTS
jgi:nitrite reductase (NADH) small subunit